MSVKEEFAEAVAALPDSVSVEEAFGRLYRAFPVKQVSQAAHAEGTAASFAGLSDVLELLASLPGPTDVLALRPSPVLQERLNHLLAKSREAGLSEQEQAEWAQYEYLEHLVRLAKARAAAKLKAA